eukprot:Pgem_evm1s10025
MIVSILAISRLGGFYVPLSKTYPFNIICDIILKNQLQYILSLPNDSVLTLLLEHGFIRQQIFEFMNLFRPTESLAYILPTSGK